MLGSLVVSKLPNVDNLYLSITEVYPFVNAKPIGFLSYVREDDLYEQGRITETGKLLSGEVRLQSGDPFPIFQDIDIDWGQQWMERIEESIDSVTFLIPIITPGFFKSDVCRSEYLQFIDREKRLNRNDLILPVYYIDCPILNDKEKRRAYADPDTAALL